MADEQFAVPADAHGQRAPLHAALRERHCAPQHQRAAAIRIQKVPRAQVGGERHQPRGDLRRQTVAGDGLRPERAGAHPFRERARAHIDADADAGIAQSVFLKAAAGLGEDAAELLAIQIYVVDPFDPAFAPGQRPDGLRDGDRGGGGEQRRLSCLLYTSDAADD